jgi:hypothetical protein
MRLTALIDNRVLSTFGPRDWGRLATLAGEDAPITWETLEDKGLLAAFRRLPTQENVKQVLATAQGPRGDIAQTRVCRGIPRGGFPDSRVLSRATKSRESAKGNNRALPPRSKVTAVG